MQFINLIQNCFISLGIEKQNIMKKKLLVIFAILLIGISVNGQNDRLSADINGQTLYFEITSSKSPYEVGVENLNDKNLSGHIQIPNTFIYEGNEYLVTSIGDMAFAGFKKITSITIPSSVTSIGDYAFAKCSGLTSITIPSSVTSIGEWAFTDCSGLTSITIPNSVTSIGDWAFVDCNRLASITIPNSLTSIEDNTFLNCSGLTSITIPNSVKTIGDFAFQRCRSLTSVVIPSSVREIGDFAFADCDKLVYVEMSASNPPKYDKEYTFNRKSKPQVKIVFK